MIKEFDLYLEQKKNKSFPEILFYYCEMWIKSMANLSLKYNAILEKFEYQYEKENYYFYIITNIPIINSYENIEL